MSQPVIKMLQWFAVAALAAILTYSAFRGYLSPEMLLGFANTFSC